MKKTLFLGILAFLLGSFAQAQDFQTFLGKFSEIPASGLVIGEMSTPETLDASLNTFVGAETETKVLPLGKISTGKNILYVFYITFGYDNDNKKNEVSINVQAFSTKGEKKGEQKSFLSISDTDLDYVITEANKFRIIPNAKNKMKFLVKESFFLDKGTEVEYVPKNKTYIVDKL